MATEAQRKAAKFLAANSRWRVKRETQKAVILHCTDANIRLRVGPRSVWRQHRVISRTSTEWINIAKLRLETAELARRQDRATASAASAASSTARSG